MGTCVNCQWAGRPTYKSPCSECKGYSKHETVEIRTNGDRIRAMSDEELAEVLGKLVHCGGCPMRDNCKVDDLPCNNVLLEWHKQPVEEEPCHD